jgi:hypothetical protein
VAPSQIHESTEVGRGGAVAGGTGGSETLGSLGSARPEEVSGRAEPPRSMGSPCPEEVSGRAKPPSLGVQCSPLGLGQLRR